jgi:hypothetical protein
MTGGGYEHLHPQVRATADLDNATRIARIRAERWIEYPAVARALEVLQETFEQPLRDRMENVLLIGESGMGKTMLVTKFERANAVAEDVAAGVRRRPVVVVLMPPDPTPGEFFDRLLTTLGAPSLKVGRGAKPEQRREVATAILREISTRVLVIDEINSILAGTARQQRLFLQLLRFLSNDLKMALICVGVPEARHALLSDAQLRSRFCDIELPLWRADADLQTFVTRLVTGLPLRRPSPIDSPKLRRLLVERSGGITICICRAIEKTAIAAIRSGREMIDLAGLADDAIWRGIALPSSTAFTVTRGRRSEVRLR